MVVSEPFDPLEFLHVAESLAERDSSEASLRTAINRFYYTAFLTSREALQVSGARYIHGLVIGELRRHDRRAGDHLERLRALRGLSDYDLEVEDALRRDWQRNYRMARRLANFVLERLQ